MSMTETVKLIPIFGLDTVIRTLAPKEASFDKMLTSFPESIKNICRLRVVRLH